MAHLLEDHVRGLELDLCAMACVLLDFFSACKRRPIYLHRRVLNSRDTNLNNYV